MKITARELQVLLDVVNRSPMSTAEQLVIQRVLNELARGIKEDQSEDVANQGEENQQTP